MPRRQTKIDLFHGRRTSSDTLMTRRIVHHIHTTEEATNGLAHGATLTARFGRGIVITTASYDNSANNDSTNHKTSDTQQQQPPATDPMTIPAIAPPLRPPAPPPPPAAPPAVKVATGPASPAVVTGEPAKTAPSAPAIIPAEEIPVAAPAPELEAGTKESAKAMAGTEVEVTTKVRPLTNSLPLALLALQAALTPLFPFKMVILVVAGLAEGVNS